MDDLLRHVTVGEGPGLKLPLLNETLRRVGGTAQWTILSDDDLRFRTGDVTSFLDLCERAHLDLAQPARAHGTQASHQITAAVRHGHPMWHGIRKTLAVWRPWRRRPSWSKR